MGEGIGRGKNMISGSALDGDGEEGDGDRNGSGTEKGSAEPREGDEETQSTWERRRWGKVT
jgi:hypothetical protein